jgi:hypothetical protein
MLNIDWRKWFDRMQPQTLQIAAMLLYLNGFFALISVIDSTDYLGYLRDLENTSGISTTLYRKLSGGSTLSLIFEVALCALILHPQSRSHQKIWYR